MKVGAYIYGTNMDNIESFETLSGRRMNYVHKFISDAESCPVDILQQMVDREITPILTIEPHNTLVADIAAGVVDSYYVQMATDISTITGEVIVRWGHEMNGDWYPWGFSPDYVDAWIRVTGLLRQASNVKMMWCPNIHDSGDSAPYYPGDEYVDIVALDGYCFDNHPDELKKWGAWRSPEETFQASYDAFIAAYPDKPFFIAETGARSKTRDKAVYIRGLFSWLRLNPGIDAVVWFNNPTPATPENSWAVDQSPESLEAWKDELRLLICQVEIISIPVSTRNSLRSSAATWAETRNAAVATTALPNADIVFSTAYTSSSQITRSHLSFDGFNTPGRVIRSAVLSAYGYSLGWSTPAYVLKSDVDGSAISTDDFDRLLQGDQVGVFPPIWSYGSSAVLIDDPSAITSLALISQEDMDNVPATKPFELTESFNNTGAPPAPWFADGGTWSDSSTFVHNTGTQLGKLIYPAGILDGYFVINMGGSTSTSRRQGIVCRYVDADNYMYADCDGAQYRLVAVNGGIETVNATAACAAWPAQMYLEFTNGTMKLKADNVTVLTDWAYANGVTPGGVGILAHNLDGDPSHTVSTSSVAFGALHKVKEFSDEVVTLTCEIVQRQRQVILL